MKLILIGNYRPDGQESMQRFAQMLAEGFEKYGVAVEHWRPVALSGGLFPSTITGIGKWFGYLDKWVLFPIYLRARRLFLNNKKVHFHICDHSNAPYLRYLPKTNTVITCHDVIAIRAGLGYSGTYVSASRMGRLLQKRILHSLQKAKQIAAVSHLTLNQLKELTNGSAAGKNWQVIHNGFNADFSPLPEKASREILAKAGLSPGESFILHVGSDLPRKNRRLLLDMAAALGESWEGKICFAGKALEPALWHHAEQLGLQHRIVSVVKPGHSTLQALYSACETFVFPSFSEGFGWPVIEGQACGAPVLASNIEPMPEIGGKGALYADPTEPAAFAKAFLRLQDKQFREEMVQKGFHNIHRFQPEIMIQAYLNIHGLTGYVTQTS